MKKDNKNKMDEIVALIPAAGVANRFGKLPCSKEVLPIGVQSDGSLSNQKPKVLMSYLVDSLKEASIKKIFIILRKGKWDIPNYFGDGSEHGVNIGYLIQNLPYGVPFTLDQAYPFVKNSLVVLGFADTIYKNSDIFPKLSKRLRQGNSHIVLGLFPADDAGNADRVEIDNVGKIKRVISKPGKSNAQLVWATAIWKPEFTKFMHRYLSALNISNLKSEIQIGQIVQAAIENEFAVEGIQVSNHPPLDVGNVDSLKHLWVST